MPSMQYEKGIWATFSTGLIKRSNLDSVMEMQGSRFSCVLIIHNAVDIRRAEYQYRIFSSIHTQVGIETKDLTPLMPQNFLIARQIT